MQRRWEDAIAINKSLIELFPEDVEAYNRLGKALTEAGKYGEAKEALQKALEISPNNSIAKKNLQRLSHLGEEASPTKEEQPKIAPHLFIEETGNTGFSTLWEPAPQEVLARLPAGEIVKLKVSGHNLMVENGEGKYIGLVEPKLAARLIKLIEGGNKYEAAITSVGEHGVRIIIKEVYKHPSQSERISFPPKVIDDFKSYIRGSALKYEAVEEDYSEEEMVAEEEQEEDLEAEGFIVIEEPRPPQKEKEEEEVEIEEEEEI